MNSDKKALIKHARIKVKNLESAIKRTSSGMILERLRRELEIARIALAALEAKPVAYIFRHPAGKQFWNITDESNKDSDDVFPVYELPQLNDKK